MFLFILKKSQTTDASVFKLTYNMSIMFKKNKEMSFLSLINISRKSN